MFIAGGRVGMNPIEGLWKIIRVIILLFTTLMDRVLDKPACPLAYFNLAATRLPRHSKQDDEWWEMHKQHAMLYSMANTIRGGLSIVG